MLKDTRTDGESTAAGESRVKWTVKPMRLWEARYNDTHPEVCKNRESQEDIYRKCTERTLQRRHPSSTVSMNLNDQVNIVSVP